ncbi:hypothetical protein VPD39_26715 [Burkholderia vietnamiensis]|nr:hypothetical protein [Burkholderia vietnamiensis]MEC4600530.1 hypothetical protein [Burkholderia vietnamiensis]
MVRARRARRHPGRGLHARERIPRRQRRAARRSARARAVSPRGGA